jgi:hypothetical protein
MISQKCYDYFDKALAQAPLQAIDAKPFENVQGDLLKVCITEQGGLVFQIKAPVYPTAAMALIKALYEQDERAFDVQVLCKELDCPDTYRHQVQWVLDQVGSCLG